MTRVCGVCAGWRTGDRLKKRFEARTSVSQILLLLESARRLVSVLKPLTHADDEN